MIRFLFLDLLAAVAGFAVFLCSVFVEGILEAFGSSQDSYARAKPVANLINQYLFDPAARALGYHVGGEHHAVPAHIVMILLISLGLIVFSLWLRRRLDVENPSRAQHLVEVFLDALQGLMQGSSARSTGRICR